MALLLSPNDVTLAEKVHALEKEAALGDEGAGSIVDQVLGVSEESGDIDDELSAIAAEPPAKPPSDTEFWAPEQPAGEPPPLWPDKRDAAAEPSFKDAEPAQAEPPPGPGTDIDSLLGAVSDDESFKIEHVSAIFNEQNEEKTKEITTATLGDLYFSQGQFDRAIRIFEKLAHQRPTPELSRKINACRVRLGVDQDALIRNRQIEVLRGLLVRVRAEFGHGR
jgi:hypothetical protein